MVRLSSLAAPARAIGLPSPLNAHRLAPRKGSLPLSTAFASPDTDVSGLTALSVRSVGRLLVPLVSGCRSAIAQRPVLSPFGSQCPPCPPIVAPWLSGRVARCRAPDHRFLVLPFNYSIPLSLWRCYAAAIARNRASVSGFALSRSPTGVQAPYGSSPFTHGLRPLASLGRAVIGGAGSPPSGRFAPSVWARSAPPRFSRPSAPSAGVSGLPPCGALRCGCPRAPLCRAPPPPPRFLAPTGHHLL